MGLREAAENALKLLDERLSDWATEEEQRDTVYYEPAEQLRKALKEDQPFDVVADVEDFHRKFSLLYGGIVRGLPQELRRFREDFLKEELDEYTRNSVGLEFELGLRTLNHETVNKHLEEMLDALVDLVYVAVGTAHLHGFDFREAWRRVQAANMAKIRAEKPGDSKRGSTFDVVKPAGWKAPDHSDLVARNIYTGQT